MSPFKDINRIVANMNRGLIIFDDGVQARRRMSKGFLVRPWLTADRMLQLCCYVQLMGERRMAESSFFIYMRIEPNMLDEMRSSKELA